MKSRLIKLAADGLLEKQEDVEPENAGKRHVDALTAYNLERVPEADQLAPGIRLIDEINTTTHMDIHLPLEEQAHGVPPELDPRTSEFRPQVHRSGSVYSVAVQPGSPTGTQPDTDMHTREASPTSSVIFSGSNVTRPSTLSNSIATSEAGSLASDMSDNLYSQEIHDQDSLTDRQHIGEGQLLGNDSSFEGSMLHTFGPTPEDILMSGPPLLSRTVSATATVATSPSASVAPSVSSQRDSGDESL
jgi:hypothetical protein